MVPVTQILLVSTLALGTTITLMSSHWVIAWVGLEINTMAILPLMIQSHHPRAAEATTKYFMAQAAAAAVILFASMYNAWTTGQWAVNNMSHPHAITLASLGLAMKMGIAPLHIWLPEVLQGVSLTTGLILSTWQKLAPFALLTQLVPSGQQLFVLMGLMSTLVGGWAGLDQTQLRKILAYSSIAHMGWILLVLQFSKPLALLTLLTYFLMTFSAFILFKINKVININSLSMSWSKAPVLTALTPLIILSLGGLPPLMGFGPKWMILSTLTTFNLSTVAVLGAFSSLLSLYFYLRLTYAMSLTLPPNTIVNVTSWRLDDLQATLPLATTAALSITLLPMLPTILAMIN
nr:NADH dehydrogenase subunit 2 [Coelonotus leiaspis]WKL05502.1 NADH dehydrogenase subunit 2 [Coelonotus leiaspis]WKL05506.1 NADH dehydrogenase subunit 2 [Coelonotus leiaspis]WKL05507.1 NADH dehydrogenase subunit 2 [Coelonotus leiaspis]WKL05508.1 NADH dehydrogenase subunit 2 [Coelonotus leiaspis]